nr:MAG TPA: hypothetical protein [Caudoviricetes sp.]
MLYQTFFVLSIVFLEQICSFFYLNNMLLSFRKKVK